MSTDITPELAAKLEALREPFPDSHVAYRPQPWCKACSEAQYKHCSNHRFLNPCSKCGQRVTEAHIDLAYVGHAETTDRLLKSDPGWTWKPMARDIDPQVMAAACATGNPEIVQMVIDASPPKFDHHGGMWMNLTVHGVTRPGYGDAQGKKGPNAVKEIIGDGIRNAGMRFGMGLDLWSKSDMGELEAAKLAVASEQDRAAEQPQVQRPASVSNGYTASQNGGPGNLPPQPPQGGALPVPTDSDGLDKWRPYAVQQAVAAGFGRPDGAVDGPRMAAEYAKWSGGAAMTQATPLLVKGFAEHLTALGAQQRPAA